MMSTAAVICTSFGAFTIVIYSLLIAFLIAYRHQFNTSFYKIFISLGVADILQRIVTELFIFFPIDGVLSAFFATQSIGFIPVFGMYTNHFVGIAEAIGHLMMATNRFTALNYPFQYATMWTNRRLYLAIAAQWLIALLIPIFILFSPCSYALIGVDSFLLEVTSLPFIQAMFGMSFVVVVGVTLITFALNLFALVGYIRHRSTMTSQQRQSNKGELRLFAFSIAVFFIYCLLAAYELFELIAFLQPTAGWSLSIDYYRAVNELVCDVNPYLLLLTSSAIRNQFFNLLFGCNRTIVNPKPQQDTGGHFVSTRRIGESKPTA